jgi:hypothetical protein
VAELKQYTACQDMAGRKPELKTGGVPCCSLCVASLFLALCISNCLQNSAQPCKSGPYLAHCFFS